MSGFKEKKEVAETPLMKQYNHIKAQYPDALLLFRVGDFYETFGEDAVKASKILGIVLTKRANGAAAFVDLAGFPHHSLDNYLPKLVRAGNRVAICDQLEDPKLSKTIVKRGVTELVTPGLGIGDKLIQQAGNHFLCALSVEFDTYGLAFIDLSTGEFFVAQGPADFAEKLIQSFQPGEILISKGQAAALKQWLGEKWFFFTLDDWIYTETYGRDKLLQHFETNSLKGFGVEEWTLAQKAAGACLHYLGATQHDKVQHISTLARIEQQEHVWLDRFTIRNLELFQANHEGGLSFFEAINQTLTPMGARLLKRWLAFPLTDIMAIEARLSVVSHFFAQPEAAGEISELLEQFSDLERLMAKVAVQKVNPRELLQLAKSLQLLEPIKAHCLAAGVEELYRIGEQINPCPHIRERIQQELMPDAPLTLAKGLVIAAGVSAELDELRSMQQNAKAYLLQLQLKEQERTGIASLKVAFNNVFGYYLEVTHAHKHKVPEDWIRKQTLVNAERYITPELKEFEEKILNAEERIQKLEAALYQQLMLAVADYIQPVQVNASIVAKLDCLLAFAKQAHTYQYCKPKFSSDYSLHIVEGRHAVIERLMPHGTPYVSNSVRLAPDDTQIMMITGPNMSGKSALLRQTALIVLMAQMGSYVPAEAYEAGIVDKIFTRVGASDNISSGESTFMVEMNETASIMNNLSAGSLILLDEIGRGTSTYDGISIAWAIAEYVHEHPHAKAKTLFATHYHELNDMASQFERIKNFNVSVKELNQKVIFLRKLKEGGSNHSFGIHVAKMAGMPASIVHRASDILKELEKTHRHHGKRKTEIHASVQKGLQLSFFQLNDPVLEQIKIVLETTEIEQLTPVEALLKLQSIKQMLGGK